MLSALLVLSEAVSAEPCVPQTQQVLELLGRAQLAEATQRFVVPNISASDQAVEQQRMLVSFEAIFREMGYPAEARLTSLEPSKVPSFFFGPGPEGKLEDFAVHAYAVRFSHEGDGFLFVGSDKKSADCRLGLFGLGLPSSRPDAPQRLTAVASAMLRNLSELSP